MNIPNVEDIVIRAKHCPHYLTASYVKQYGNDKCLRCWLTPHVPNKQLRTDVPKQR